MTTHGIIIDFGKHKGELLTRVPIGYIRWMANTKDMAENWKELARAEHERRGGTMPVIELSGHAIDNASLRCRKIWQETKLNDDEGLYSWLIRVTLEAIEKGEHVGGKIKYLGMKFVVEQGEEYPALKTIMR
jgi:hypothetical protein